MTRRILWLILVLFISAQISFFCSASINPYLVDPAASQTVEQNELFSVTTGFTCSGTCSGVVAKLDPQETINANQLLKSKNQNAEEIKSKYSKKLTQRLIINLKEGNEPDSVGSVDTIDSIDEVQEKVINDMADDRSAFEKIFSLKPKKLALTQKYKEVSAIAADVSEEGFEELLNNPDVVSIEPDRMVKAALTESIPQINADDYWSRLINSTNIKGSGQTVCVVDTGINADHSGFGGRVLAEKCYCSYDGNCCPDGTSEDDNAEDDHGHGTHCAGIVAADYGSYQGVAPEANIVAVKSLNAAGHGYTSEIIAGIDWCVANKDAYNISVISLSLGGSTTYSTDCDASNLAYANSISAAVAEGIVVFAATGNDADHTGISSPACVSDAISVGAVYDANVGGLGWSSCTDPSTYQDLVTCFTNSAANLDILAPGALTTSLDYAGTTSVKGGTSMATPMAAGAGILLKDYYRTKYNYGISPAEVEQKLKDSAVPVSDPYSSRYYKRINLENIVEKGVIPEQADWNGVDPFYTISSNPGNDSCLDSLSDGQTCNSTWLVNATEIGTWEFFTIYEEGSTQVFTSVFNITVVEPTPDAPAVELISPIDQDYINPAEINFTYRVNSSKAVNNCSLLVNNIVMETDTEIQNNTELIFNWQDPIGGNLSWSVVCTDSFGNSNEPDYESIAVTKMTGFDGTNLSTVPDIENITEMIIEEPEYGTINFTESVNLSGGADINQYVKISKNKIEIDSENIPQLNKSAVLELRGIIKPNPVILRNGEVCEECVVLSSGRDFVRFQVSHFSTYEVAQTSIGSSGRYSTSPGSPGFLDVEGGNITKIGLSSNSSTLKWQGFYGNIFGKVVLGLTGGYELYNFGTLNGTAVYASQNDTFDFTSKAAAVVSEIDSAFGFSNPDSVDRAEDVFTGVISIDGIVDAPSTYLYDSRFRCYAIDDGTPSPETTNYAFGAEVNNSGEVGFNGGTWEYELMVPLVDSTTPVYYFFIKI